MTRCSLAGVNVVSEDTLQRVRLALIEREIAHRVDENIVLIHYGSALVQIEVADGPPTPTIAVRAVVLVDVGIDDNEDELRVLRMLNERNGRLRFGKFFYDREQERIVVEYEILASHMQHEELVHATSVVAHLADDHDDLLRDQIGCGRRASDVAGWSTLDRPF